MEIKKAHFIDYAFAALLLFIITVQVQAQTSSLTIPLVQNANQTKSIRANYKQMPLSLKLDNKVKGVQLTIHELKEFQQNKLRLNYTIDTTVVKGGSRVNIRFTMDSLPINCLVLYNVPAVISFATPLVDTTEKASISWALLNTVGIARKDKNSIHISNVESKNIRSSCKTNTSTNHRFTFNQAHSVKLIPCSRDSSLVNDTKEIILLLQKAGCKQIAQEAQVPPRQKAIDRLEKGFTIRYFSNSDLTIANTVEQILRQKHPSVSIHKENMLSAFKNQAIPNYIEIWIKYID